MSTAVKLAGFAAMIAAVFGLALVGGRIVGPVDEETGSSHRASHGSVTTEAESSGHDAHDDTADPDSAQEIPGGLMVSHHGYTLDLAETHVEAGKNRPVRFTIRRPDGAPVTEYDVEHDKELHLIAVRRDFTGFQHVHPTIDTHSGVWSVDLDLTPGTWRIFTDFKATGASGLTLGADLTVRGDYQPAPPAGETRTAMVDGYEVHLDGDLTAGADAKVTLNVKKDGEPVTDLQPYLGAYGHLVALRGGDLAYLHVHPDGTPDDGTTKPGPDVTFYAAVPSPGSYHLYLDFQHDGVVRTAAFNVTARAVAEATGNNTTSDSTTSDSTTPAEHGSHSGH